MPRPRKWKKVCCLPASELYGPLRNQGETQETIVMSVEEYETIRLIDLERFTQEECSERMQVSRGTVQKLYTDAREKLAISLVNGHVLMIAGGDYEFYNEQERRLACGRCRRHACGKNLQKNFNLECKNN